MISECCTLHIWFLSIRVVPFLCRNSNTSHVLILIKRFHKCTHPALCNVMNISPDKVTGPSSCLLLGRPFCDWPLTTFGHCMKKINKMSPWKAAQERQWREKYQCVITYFSYSYYYYVTWLNTREIVSKARYRTNTQ